ncbi:MAG: putative phosphotransferase [uncultured Arthrobacter sp.]|uniref:Putative phosphotransferase n=1 Tax=uncultured Arthrobacter sp. TaxID=114050 RepID=A0A6J4HRJ8_9MICC|nr:MAG: putative phosphotransferase [uncultured Arthrobacter sp.]
MELAAIASAAVPGLAPTGVTGAPDDSADFDAALLVDAAGKQWRVRSPRHPEASMRLETELQALRAFTPAVRAELPFLIPHIAGSVRQGNLSTFVYSHLEGSTRDLETLAAGGRGMAAEIGRALAAIHELPKALVQQANLPSYEANEFRTRKLNELDQAATTGRIPSVLLRRWEHALEDVTLWRFSPTVVHGDLHEDHLLISGSRISAVTGWTDLRIGDPADDFAWLAAVADASFVDSVYAAYAKARGAADQHLARRAALAAEFALAQWMVRGLAMEDPQMIAEAHDMMASLEADVVAFDLTSPGDGHGAARGVSGTRGTAGPGTTGPGTTGAATVVTTPAGSTAAGSTTVTGKATGTTADGERPEAPAGTAGGPKPTVVTPTVVTPPVIAPTMIAPSVVAPVAVTSADPAPSPGLPAPELGQQGKTPAQDAAQSSPDKPAEPAADPAAPSVPAPSTLPAVQRAGSHAATHGVQGDGTNETLPAVTRLRPAGTPSTPAAGSTDHLATTAIPIISSHR